MHKLIRAFTAVLALICVFYESSGQSFPAFHANSPLRPDQHFDSSIMSQLIQSRPVRMTRLLSGNRPKTINSSSIINHSGINNAINVLPRSLSMPLGQPGCIDTSDNIMTIVPNEDLALGGTITKLSDGNLLVPGYHQQAVSPYYMFPYLLKYSSSGNVIWSKTFDGPGVYPSNTAIAYTSFELNDGSLLIAGDMEIPEAFNDRQELILWKLDANGNLLWVQTDSCSIWTQYNGKLELTGMTQDPSGNIYLCGNQYAEDAITTHSFVLKMDAAGNIAWDKSFTFRASQCFGILYINGELSMYGTNPFVYIPDGSNDQTNCLWNMKINLLTGDTLRTKCWYANFGANSGWYSMLSRASVQQLSDGNIAVFGKALSDTRYGPVTPIVHGISATFDTSFNFLGGWMIESNSQSDYNSTMITEHASGRISYTYLSILSNFDNNIMFGAVEQGQIIKERVIHQRNFANGWVSNFLNMSPDQDVIMEWVGDSLNIVGAQQFLRLHDSDTSSICTGSDTSASWLVPYAMLPYPQYHCDSIASNIFRKTNRPVPPSANGNPQQQNACMLTSFCDSVKLNASQTTLCAGQPAVFTCRKNPECGSWPSWLYDTVNIQSDTILNDSTLVLTYRDQVKGKVSISMQGTCKGLSDSISFQVLPAAKPLSLGPDSYLCPDSVLVLRPPTGYGDYLWQDGSNADTLLVTMPGEYYVTVTNSCGFPFSDTVVVQTAPSLNFYVGPDTTVCLNDPITLAAPAGYYQYKWGTMNNGTIFNMQSVTITPTATQTYYASALTAQGCAVKDTILITTKIPVAINLGSDTSFCKGDSILLNAGSGFQNYTWSTGGSGSSIWVYSTGVYSLKAQSGNGCYSLDTCVIENVYPLPVIKLNSEDWLCEGSTRMLNAGAGYASYRWQDGSSSSTLSVDTTGIYWVKVIDDHGCSMADSVIISRLIAVPSGFLIADTIICNGYPSKIQSEGGFSSYNWSTGENGNFITVSNAGTYSLTVTDQYGCSATSTVGVSVKQCVFGIFFPNAFTPNQDGLNDIFRPTVFGNITKYQLQIFNRWGQRVFESEDFSRGWDGTMGNLQQVTGTYVWICQYQFSGEPEKSENGTLVLIR